MDKTKKPINKFGLILIIVSLVLIIAVIYFIVRPLYCGCDINLPLFFHFCEAIGAIATLAAFVALFRKNEDQEEQISTLSEIAQKLTGVTVQLAKANNLNENIHKVKNLPDFEIKACTGAGGTIPIEITNKGESFHIKDINVESEDKDSIKEVPNIETDTCIWGNPPTGLVDKEGLKTLIILLRRVRRFDKGEAKVYIGSVPFFINMICENIFGDQYIFKYKVDPLSNIVSLIKWELTKNSDSKK